MRQYIFVLFLALLANTSLAQESKKSHLHFYRIITKPVYDTGICKMTVSAGKEGFLKIKGTLTEKNNKPMPYVNISFWDVKFNNGGITDSLGQFSIPKALLEIDKISLGPQAGSTSFIQSFPKIDKDTTIELKFTIDRVMPHSFGVMSKKKLSKKERRIIKECVEKTGSFDKCGLPGKYWLTLEI